MHRENLKKTNIYIFWFIIGALTLFPFLHAFLSSFKSLSEVIVGGSKLFPTLWRFENYSEAWGMANFSKYTRNSVVVTVFTIIGVVITSSMTGYCLARHNFPGKRIILGVFASTIFIGVGTATIYPIAMVSVKLGLLNSLMGIIIAQIATNQVVNVFLTYSYCSGMPKEIEDAAVIDGCGIFRTYWNIVLPLMIPILATVAIFTFKNAWNNLLLPMIFTLGRPDLRTLVVGLVSLKGSGEGASSWNLMMAGTMMSLVPMLFAYLVLQRYFISGLTQGSVKG